MRAQCAYIHSLIGPAPLGLCCSASRHGAQQRQRQQRHDEPGRALDDARSRTCTRTCARLGREAQCAGSGQAEWRAAGALWEGRGSEQRADFAVYTVVGGHRGARDVRRGRAWRGVAWRGVACTAPRCTFFLFTCSSILDTLLFALALLTVITRIGPLRPFTRLLRRRHGAAFCVLSFL